MVIGQVEEELFFLKPFLRLTDGILIFLFMNLACLMWNIWKNNQNEGLQKIGPIVCTVENEIPKYQTARLYMQNSFQVGPEISGFL